MGIGKPGVQREHRQFHAETHQEAEVAEQSEAAAGGAGRQLGEIQGELVSGEGEGQAADQDQQRCKRCVEDEFRGRVLPVLPSPDGDQEVNRDQLEFPGQEEQQEILGQKDNALG